MIMRNRTGSTLVELVVTLVVLGILGAGMARLMTSQSRFIHNNEGLSEARRVARTGLNVLLTDLRSIDSDSGVVTAQQSSLTLRVPFWTGISCGPDGSGAATHVSMPPVDSLLYNWGSSAISGQGYVDGGGIAHYTQPAGSIDSGNLSVCNAESVGVVPGGRIIRVSPAIAGAAAGRPVIFFQNVTYYFGTSSDYWPLLGLFRRMDATSFVEELASPFDSTAHFEYYVAGSAAPVANPASTAEKIGVDLRFVGLNRRNTTNGRTLQAPVETAIYFKNR